MPAWLTETGDGPPVLLLHGWTGFRRVWGDLPAQLETAGMRVLAIDLPGWGAHPAPRGMRHDAFGYADALDAFLAERGPLSIVGHSLGGQVGLVLTARHPELVRRLVVIGTPVVPAPRGFVRPNSLVKIVGLPGLGGPLSHLALALMARRPSRIATAYRRSVFDVDRLAGDPRFTQLAEDLGAHLRATPTRVVAESLRRIARMDLRPILGEIHQPTLSIVGERDWSVNPANSATIAGGVRNGTLLRVPEVAHVAFLERPEIVLPAIVEFLR